MFTKKGYLLVYLDIKYTAVQREEETWEKN